MARRSVRQGLENLSFLKENVLRFLVSFSFLKRFLACNDYEDRTQNYVTEIHKKISVLIHD